MALTQGDLKKIREITSEITREITKELVSESANSLRISLEKSIEKAKPCYSKEKKGLYVLSKKKV